MAIYPCNFSPHRYYAAQQTAYYTSIMDHSVRTYRGRLCPEHFGEVQEAATGVLNDIEDLPQPSAKCESCGEDRLVMLQVKLFAAKSQVLQLVGDLCAKCATDLEADLHISTWELLPDR